MKSLLLIGALVTLTALSTPAQTNQRSADAAQALRQYEWKLRTEVQRKGETKNVQVASVWFDSNGQKQTIVISKSPEPDLPKFGLRKAIAEKKVTEFRKTVRELGDLARSYAELSPEQLQRFMTTASVTPEVTAGVKLVRAEGRDVLHAGDSMTIWTDATSRRQRLVQIQTVFDKNPVVILSEFQDLPQGGPTFMSVSRVNYDDGAVVIITQNYEHKRVGQQTAGMVQSRHCFASEVLWHAAATVGAALCGRPCAELSVEI